MRTPSLVFRQRASLVTPGEDWGDGSTDGEPREVRCRVDWGYRRYADGQGVDVTVEGVLLCRHDVAVAPGDRVTLPSVGDDEATRTVFTVNPAFDPRGHVRHLEVTFR